jgi:hypothetical protein
VCWLAGTRLTVAIMQKGRSIDAETNSDTVLFEQFTPGVVDSGPIGLKGMRYFDISLYKSVNGLKGFFVVGARQDEGLTSVPYDR